MTERRYDDDEVAAIFEKAAEGPQTPPLQAAREAGMTLAQLQDIGREVGIAPEAVARAAHALEIRPKAGAQTILGLPIGVERSIDLHRRLTDAEWEQLVVELREVFNARGTVSSSGSFRQWTNGNLQALLEPTPTGHRLRLSTVKGNARTSIFAGSAILAMTTFAAISAGFAGHLANAAPELVILSLASLTVVTTGLLRLPAWARLRGRQMDEITSRVALETGGDGASGK